MAAAGSGLKFFKLILFQQLLLKLFSRMLVFYFNMEPRLNE